MLGNSPFGGSARALCRLFPLARLVAVSGQPGSDGRAGILFPRLSLAVSIRRRHLPTEFLQTLLPGHHPPSYQTVANFSPNSI